MRRFLDLRYIEVLKLWLALARIGETLPRGGTDDWNFADDADCCEEKMSDKPNCYECKHRRSIAGNEHSRCAHPAIPDFGPMTEIASMLGGGPPFTVEGLNVVGDPHGVRMGWFFWPLNFDPTWLKSCDGFEAKEKAGAA